MEHSHATGRQRPDYDGQTTFFRRIEDFYTVFGDLFRPTSVEYSVNCLETDASVEQGVSSRNDEDGPTIETKEGAVEDSNGVTCRTLLDELEGLAQTDGYGLPAVVDLAGEALLYVDGAFHYADRDSSDHYRDWNDDPDVLDSEPYADPIQAQLRIQSAPNGIAILPRVTFYSNIWFEDTKTGRYNHLQVAAMAARLAGSFDVETVKYRGQWEDTLEMVFDDEVSLLRD